MTQGNLLTRWPKIAPTAKSEVSHINSKGRVQSGGWIIGAEVKTDFKFSKDVLHSSEKSNLTSLARRFESGFEIFEKSLMNLSIKTSMTKKRSNVLNRPRLR